MTWPNVAIGYNHLFNKYADLSINSKKVLPKIKMNHLIRMTDNFGIIQFANQHHPEIESGYTLDDNARALLVSSMHYSHFKEFKTLQFLKIYLDYIKYVQDNNGKLYNYVDKTKKINFKDWSEDAQGRAIWALGAMLKNESIPEDFKKDGMRILKKSIFKKLFEEL